MHIAKILCNRILKIYIFVPMTWTQILANSSCGSSQVWLRHKIEKNSPATSLDSERSSLGSVRNYVWRNWIPREAIIKILFSIYIMVHALKVEPGPTTKHIQLHHLNIYWIYLSHCMQVVISKASWGLMERQKTEKQFFLKHQPDMHTSLKQTNCSSDIVSA